MQIWEYNIIYYSKTLQVFVLKLHVLKYYLYFVLKYYLFFL